MTTEERIDLFQNLSPRQQEVARVYAISPTTVVAAQHLHIAPSTVKNHMSLVFARLRFETIPRNTHGRELAYLIGWMDGQDALDGGKT
jgi:DNA-binding NarL/FixJ family response regulator